MLLVAGVSVPCLAQAQAAGGAPVSFLEQCDPTDLAAGRLDSLDAEGLLQLGLCFFEQAEDVLAQRCFEAAIRKQPGFFPAYYFQGRSLVASGRGQEALPYLDQALALDGKRPEYLEVKARALEQLGRLGEAVACLEAAVQLEACPGRLFLELGALHFRLERPEVALSVYQRATRAFEPGEPTYRESLYHVGLLEYLAGRYASAEEIFTRLYALQPTNYQALAKLIQALYAQGAFERGDALKAALYAAYQRQEIEPYMRESGFCFDQFLVDGNRVFVYERFPEPESAFRKHVFFLTDAEQRVSATVFTEHNELAVRHGKKFVLARQDPSNRILYFAHFFEEDFDYEEMKRVVIKAFKGKMKPLQAVEAP